MPSLFGGQRHGPGPQTTGFLTVVSGRPPCFLSHRSERTSYSHVDASAALSPRVLSKITTMEQKAWSQDDTHVGCADVDHLRKITLCWAEQRGPPLLQRERPYTPSPVEASQLWIFLIPASGKALMEGGVAWRCSDLCLQLSPDPLTSLLHLTHHLTSTHHLTTSPHD